MDKLQTSLLKLILTIVFGLIGLYFLYLVEPKLIIAWFFLVLSHNIEKH